MEVVAVEPEVDRIEGAHRGPALLVGEGDRGQPVGGHLLAQRLEVVHGRRDRVTAVGEQALAVEDRPRVVVERHEVLVAVVAGRRLLERLGVLGVETVAPHAGQVTGEALGREEAHPVAGEPSPYVVRAALQVLGDLLLELLVVDRVRLHLDALRLDERFDAGLQRALGHVVGEVRPERSRLTATAGRLRRAGPPVAAGAETGWGGGSTAECWVETSAAPLVDAGLRVRSNTFERDSTCALSSFDRSRVRHVKTSPSLAVQSQHGGAGTCWNLLTCAPRPVEALRHVGWWRAAIRRGL